MIDFYSKTVAVTSAVGITDGLVSWSHFVDPDSEGTSEPTYPPINININGQNYPEQGVLINGNAYIPVDLVDRLRIDLWRVPHIRRVSYHQVVYVKAVELRDFNISISWDAASHTISLRSILIVCSGQFDLIMSRCLLSNVCRKWIFTVW